MSAAAASKVYDGTTAATVTLSDNRVIGDDLTASYTTALFANKNVGNAKTVNVSGISVTGTDAGNYTINTTATTTADITPISLTVAGTAADNKVYDGTTAATLNLGNTFFLAFLAFVSISLIALVHRPLPWAPNEALLLPPLYQAGTPRWQGFVRLRRRPNC